MAHPSKTRIVELGRLMVNSGMLVGRDRFLMHTLYRTLDRRRFGMRMVGMLLALSASCVLPLRLQIPSYDGDDSASVVLGLIPLIMLVVTVRW